MSIDTQSKVHNLQLIFWNSSRSMSREVLKCKNAVCSEPYQHSIKNTLLFAKCATNDKEETLSINIMCAWTLLLMLSLAIISFTSAAFTLYFNSFNSRIYGFSTEKINEFILLTQTKGPFVSCTFFYGLWLSSSCATILTHRFVKLGEKIDFGNFKIDWADCWSLAIKFLWTSPINHWLHTLQNFDREAFKNRLNNMRKILKSIYFAFKDGADIRINK
jgi:hypothetical protein